MLPLVGNTAGPNRRQNDPAEGQRKPVRMLGSFSYSEDRFG
jgi:hypothetical protein